MPTREWREGWQAKRGKGTLESAGGKNVLGFIFHTGFTTFLRKFNFVVLFLFANQNQFNFKTTRRANGGKTFCNGSSLPLGTARAT